MHETCLHRSVHNAQAIQPCPPYAPACLSPQGSSGVLLCVDELGVSLRRTWCLYEAWMGATTPEAVGAEAGAGRGAGSGAGAAGCGLSGSMAPVAGQGQPIGVVALTPRALLPEERARLFSKVRG